MSKAVKTRVYEQKTQAGQPGAIAWALERAADNNMLYSPLNKRRGLKRTRRVA